ncbi:MAG TPA: helix-turn-helix domain-containing protein [Rhizomicrobium sp.]|jgi:AcrR family transcriptional regulator
MSKVSIRDKLVHEAVRLMSERGYRETTVGDIEEAAGLTRRAGGFYRHFASKEDVIVQAVQHISEEMIAEIRLEDVLALKSPRAELLVIAQALVRHAEKYRRLRLLLQREGHKLPALRDAARRANKRLATLDVVPWVEDVMRRCGVKKGNAAQTSLMIFGPVALHIYSLDRADPAFGIVDPKQFLAVWADHWAGWLDRGGV